MTESKYEWLAKADTTLEKFRACRPLSAPAVKRLREEIKLQTTYDSNAIEGSTLSLRETVLAVKEGIAVGSGKCIRDFMAAQGYAAGFDAIFDFVEDQIELSEALILSFHRYVMLGALPEFCGVFRDHNVRILGTICKTVEYWEIQGKIHELVDCFNDPTNLLHPIEKASLFHAKYETIHPFSDGNGRTGRLLLNYMLVREGYWPVNIRYAEDRERYYEALAIFNRDNCADALTCLIAERAIEQLNYCIEIARQQQASKTIQHT